MDHGNLELWVAVVGAGAWIPQIVGWVHALAVRPRIAVYQAASVEVGFTNEGPALAVPVVLRVRNKDCVVTEAAPRVQHGQGETHEMRWRWVSEVKGFMSGIPNIEPIAFQQADPAIAVALTPRDVTTRTVNFREVGFEDEMQRHIASVTRAIEGVEGENRTSVREWRDATQWYRSSFFWREGTYSVEVAFSSSDAPEPAKLSFSFNLTRPDVARIQANVEALVGQTEAAARAGNDLAAWIPNPPIKWAWCRPTITPR